MAAKVANAPINTYFDVTPVGRILNKFSSDLQTSDNEISWNFGFLLTMIALFVLTICVSISAVPWLAFLIPVIAGVAYFVSLRNIGVFKEMNRIVSVSKSPLLSLIQETINGASTIRAFSRQATYIERNRQLLNNNILSNLHKFGVEYWMNMRLDFLVIGVMAAICSCAIFSKGHADPILLALMVNYTLQLNLVILSMVRTVQMLEGKMVSIDRLFKILEIP